MKNTQLKKIYWIVILLLMVSCAPEEQPKPEVAMAGIQALLTYEGNVQELKKLSFSLYRSPAAQSQLTQLLNTYGSLDVKAALVNRKAQHNRGTSSDNSTEDVNGTLVLPIVEASTTHVNAVVVYSVENDGTEYLKLYSMHSMAQLSNDQLLSEEYLSLPLTFLAVQSNVDGTNSFWVNSVHFRRVQSDASTRWTTVKDCQDWEIYVGDDPDPITGRNCEYEIVAEEDETVQLQGEGDGGGSGTDSGEQDTEAQDTCKTTSTEIGKIFTEADSNAKDTLALMINEYGVQFGLNTEAKLAHFLGQIGHESGSLKDGVGVVENMNYSADRLMEIWGKRFSRTDTTKANPDDYDHDPEKLANFVYSNRMGNGSVESGEGYKYRGRGIIQLTGKDNYKAFSDYYKDKVDSAVDILTNPNLLEKDSKIAIIAAMWWYKENVIDKTTDFSKTDEVFKDITTKVRNVSDTWEDRKEIYESAETEIDCVE